MLWCFVIDWCVFSPFFVRSAIGKYDRLLLNSSIDFSAWQIRVTSEWYNQTNVTAIERWRCWHLSHIFLRCIVSTNIEFQDCVLFCCVEKQRGFHLNPECKEAVLNNMFTACNHCFVSVYSYLSLYHLLHTNAFDSFMMWFAFDANSHTLATNLWFVC